MRVAVTARAPAQVAGDVLVQLFDTDAKRAGFSAADVLRPDVSNLVNHEAGALSWLETRNAKAPLALCACVDRSSRDAAVLRVLGAGVERALNDRAQAHMVVAPAPGLDLGAFVQGVLLRAYGCDEFVPDEEFTSVQALTICVEPGALARVRQQVRAAQTIADSCNQGRRLADLPANVGTPAVMASRIRKACRAHGLKVRVLTAKQINALGLGLLQAVTAGAAVPPALVIIEHRPPHTTESPVVFIGKGVTHDTGGYNLKRSRLHEMSYDKVGATALFGAMLAMARLKTPLHAVAVLPFVENTLGAKATKPGDIVSAVDGTSVCIENTDAEGRLILADCLAYATATLRPSVIIDIASLTQAAHVALGDGYSALFSTDDRLRDEIVLAGKAAGEPVWPMPLDDSHAAALQHSRAQLSNVGGHGAAASTAAAFLRHFVRTPWAHIDIANKGFAESDRVEVAAGATGYGTRMLVELAQRLASKKYRI